MAGTKVGGQKAAAKNLAKDPHFYEKIGAKGGKNGRTGGFAANPRLARIAGAKGGRMSRRNGVKNGEGKKGALLGSNTTDTTVNIAPTNYGNA